jgi:hypothetical protein
MPRWPAFVLSIAHGMGLVGVISHWAPGRFDDLRLEENR